MPCSVVRRRVAPTIGLVAVALLFFIATARAFTITPVDTPGGLRAWLVQDSQNPIITIQATFAAGSSSDPAGRSGTAHLVSGLLDEGAGTMDSASFRRALEENSIRLSSQSGRDSFSVTLTTLTDTRETGFALMRLALRQPRFDAAPLERVRGQLIAARRNNRAKPGWIARRTWSRAAFGDHPYGRPHRGTPESITAITRADLLDFAARAFVRDRLTISAVGDIVPAELAAVIDRIFGALPAAPATAPTLIAARMALSGETLVIDRDVPQSMVIFGHQGIARTSPDWHAATILLEILAGGSGSRLYREIREKRGLAYGISASRVSLDHASLIVGSVATVNERVAETIELIKSIWTDFAREGPTREEVQHTKDYLNGSFGLRFTNSGTIADVITWLQRHSLGIDYIERRRDIINGITFADLRRVALHLLQAEALVFAVVGRPVGVTATYPAPDLDRQD